MSRMPKMEVNARVLAGFIALAVALPFFDAVCALYTAPYARPAPPVAAWLLMVGIVGGLSAGWAVWLACREGLGHAAHFADRIAEGLLRRRFVSVITLLIVTALLSNGIVQRVRPKWWNVSEARGLADRAICETAAKFHFRPQDFVFASMREYEGVPVFHYVAEKEGCIYSFSAEVYPMGKVVGYPGTAGDACRKEFVREVPTFNFPVNNKPAK